MNREQFLENFEIDDGINGTNSFLFKTTACMNRHKRPRNDMELTDKENIRYDAGKSWHFEEQRLQNYVSYLLSHGHILKIDETLEQFVVRNLHNIGERDLLDNVDRLLNRRV